jgi:hypothetical protein
MASLQPIGGTNYGLFHRPQLAKPLPTKKKKELAQGNSIKCKKGSGQGRKEIKVG